MKNFHSSITLSRYKADLFTEYFSIPRNLPLIDPLPNIIYQATSQTSPRLWPSFDRSTLGSLINLETCTSLELHFHSRVFANEPAKSLNFSNNSENPHTRVYRIINLIKIKIIIFPRRRTYWQFFRGSIFAFIDSRKRV